MARARNLLALLLGITALGAFAFAAPAAAQDMQIAEFETTSSNSEAGGHPDLRTKFKLVGAGDPEIAKDVTFELPKGIYGNPSVLTQCTSVDFALTQCPPSAQAGLIVVRANYEGEPRIPARHRADLQRRPGRLGGGPLRLHRPDSGHPDHDSRQRPLGPGIPPSLHGLGHHPAGTSGGGRPQILGLPRGRRALHRTIRERLAGRTAGLSGRRKHLLQIQMGGRGQTRPALHRQPLGLR